MAPETLRLAIVTELLIGGGTEKQVVLIAQALIAAGVNVRLYCLSLSPYYRRSLDEARIEYEDVPKRHGAAVRLLQLTRRLWTFNPHVVQSTHSFANLIAAIPAKLLRAISVGSLRCELEHATEQNGRWQKWLLQVPDALILNSMAMAQQCVDSSSLPAKRIYCLPNAIDVRRFDLPARRSDSDQITVVFAGRLVASKRLDVFLKGLAQALKTSPRIRGQVIGGGPEQQSGIQLAEKLGLRNLEFLGERHDIPSLFAGADILVSCSESEGCPNVILEAMAARLPVITTPAGDSELLIEDGLHGYVIPFGEYKLLGERLIHLAASPEKRKRMGQAGRQRVYRWHQYDGLAQRLLSIYSQIADDRGIGVYRRTIREALAGAAAAAQAGS